MAGEVDVNREREWRERDLFERAFALAPEERRAFLERECAGDAELLARVSECFSHPVEDAFLLGPIAEAARAALDARATPEECPERIGGHAILGELGRGGEGVVYLARQTDPPRDVALKVLQRDASERIAARFRREAGILARLRHPNIAQVYRAGEDGGRPWMAMELVDGPPLLEHARRLDRGLRLALLVEIADAVHHAHEKGVVHRDLKPANVRITADGRPKVLDFGIARVEGTTELGEALRTRTGEVLGTLLYMAPEQLGGDPGAVDARADVFALGLLLYELVTDRPAFEPTGRTREECYAQLLSREIPPLGSLDPESRGELEAIAAKALEREPARRYRDAGSFARDLERHLAGEPVEARPGGRLRRYARRALRRPALLGGLTLGVAGFVLAFASGRAAAFVALAAGIATLAFGLARAERARRLADREGMRARRMLDFLEEMLRSPDPERDGSSALLIDVLERATRDLGERFAGEPRIESALRCTLGITYRGLGRYEDARRELARSADLAGRSLPAAPEERATSLGWLAIVSREQGRFAESEELWREVIALRSEALGALHAKTWEARGQQALALYAGGNRREGLALAREALAGLRGAKRVERREVAIACGNLGSLLVQDGAFEEAEPFVREAAATLTELCEQEQPDAFVVRHNLAVVLGELGRLDEAEEEARASFEMHRRVFGEEHRGTNVARVTWAALRMDRGEIEDARAMALAAAGHLRRLPLDRRNPARIAAGVLLAEIRLRRGATDAALRSAERLERELPASLPAGHRVRRRLARVLSEARGPRSASRAIGHSGVSADGSP